MHFILLLVDRIQYLFSEAIDAIMDFLSKTPSVVDIYAYHIFIPYAFMSVSLALMVNSYNIYTVAFFASSLASLFTYFFSLTESLETYLKRILFWGALLKLGYLMQIISDAALLAMGLSAVYIHPRQEFEGIISLVATAIGIGINSPLFKFFSLLFAGSGYGFSIIPDEGGAVRELLFYMGIVFCLAYLAVSASVLGVHIEEEADTMRETVDLQPPAIYFSPERNIRTDKQQDRLHFNYTVSDAYSGESRILATTVALYRTPEDSDPISTTCEPFDSIVDNISGMSYEVVIPLKDIDPNTDKDNDGLVAVAELKMEQLDKEYIDDNIIVRFSKYFDFNGVPIYGECKYYMIIVVVDWYGNARWEIYDVTEYVHSLAPEGTTTQTRGYGGPRVWTQNIGGKMEGRGIVSHYYVLNGKPYVPWIKIRDRLQRCFTLNIVLAGKSIRINELNTPLGPEAIEGGIFILRCYGLWRHGTIRILANGAELTTIIFAYIINVPMLYLETLLPLILLLVIMEGVSAWYRGRRRK